MKFNRCKTGGFTLIELLVVISIIGLLASTVLVATTRARYGGKTAAMKTELLNLKNVLEVYYQNNGSKWGNLQSQISPSLPCPTNAAFNSTMFGDASVKAQLNAILAIFPGATMECLAGSDLGAAPANVWIITISAPPSSGATNNKWCITNSAGAAGVSFNSLYSGYNGPGERSTVGTETVVVGGILYTTRCTVISTNTDWK